MAKPVSKNKYIIQVQWFIPLTLVLGSEGRETKNLMSSSATKSFRQAWDTGDLVSKENSKRRELREEEEGERERKRGGERTSKTREGRE